MVFTNSPVYVKIYLDRYSIPFGTNRFSRKDKKMKRILLALVLIFALLFTSSCDLIGMPDVSDISIDDDGYVVINGVKTEYHVDIDDTVTVDENNYLVVNGHKTEHKVHTKDEISVDSDGYLVVNGEKTEYLVDKEDVVTLDDDGYVVVNGNKTQYKVHTKDVVYVDSEGYVIVNGVNTGIKADTGSDTNPGNPDLNYDGSPVTITFYHTMGSSLQQVLNEAITEFNALYPNITVEHERVGSYDDVCNRINLDIVSGNTPNLAYCYTDHVALYNMAGAVQPLDDFINDETVGFTDAQLDDFIEGFYNEGKTFGDGKMYTLPLSKSTEVMYYNKTFFDQHNIPVPTTWDEVAAACEYIKSVDPYSIPLGYDSEANWFITLCQQYGSPYTSATGDKFLFNNDKNKEFVMMLREWYQKKWFTTMELSGCYTSSLFLGEVSGLEDTRSYMCISSSGGASYHDPGNSFEVGIAPLPQVDINNPKVICQGPSVCIFKQEDKQEVAASWLFLKFLTTDLEFQASMSMSSGYAPVIKSVIKHPVYAEFLRTAGPDNINAYAALVALLQSDAYFASPAFVGSDAARDQVGLLMQKCLVLPDTGLEAAINKAFADAIAACKMQET